MSILSAVEQITPKTLLILLACSLVTIAILGFVGFFKEREQAVIDRLFPLEPVSPLFINAGIAVFVYLALAVVIGIFVRAQNGGTVPQAEDGTLPPGLLILLSTVVPAACFVWMLLGLRWIVAHGLSRVGLTRQPVGEAMLAAAGIMLAAYPLIFLASNLSELLYQHFHWEHESAHELLLSLKSADHGWEKFLAVVAAVVLAPLSEELLFRGHIQAGIRRLLERPRAYVAPAAPVATFAAPVGENESAALPAGTLAYQSAPVIAYAPVVASMRSFFASLSAVLITSIIFASIHPAWSRAPIFVLSLFLGMAYERRGNIWVNIFIHALFNGSMIALYLSTQQPGA